MTFGCNNDRETALLIDLERARGRHDALSAFPSRLFLLSFLSMTISGEFISLTQTKLYFSLIRAEPRQQDTEQEWLRLLEFPLRYEKCSWKLIKPHHCSVNQRSA